ncbi:NAD(P)-binding protein [Cadophora sp. DSE1049]|nr:NAD(P)-binding protein [Cadophora sp. DSE1049]
MTVQSFKDKVVFITGGTSGLGLATTKLFLASGAYVFCVDLHERSILTTLPSPNLAFLHCDVSDPSACHTAVTACIQRFSRLDILFSCAGILAPLQTVVDLPIADFQNTINTNLCATFYLCKAAIPHMKKQGGGAIVRVASTSGLYADYGFCAYNASKAGVINLTRSIALDHARDGIRANVVCPGSMRTPMVGALGDREPGKEFLERVPAGRMCEPEEVARVVLFLAGEESSYTTGTSELF